MPARRRAYRFVAVAAIALVAATTAQAAEIKRIGGDGIGDRVIPFTHPKLAVTAVVSEARFCDCS
jgi:hypothetical protein